MSNLKEYLCDAHFEPLSKEDKEKYEYCEYGYHFDGGKFHLADSPVEAPKSSHEPVIYFSKCDKCNYLVERYMDHEFIPCEQCFRKEAHYYIKPEFFVIED